MKKQTITQEQIDIGNRIREWAGTNFRRFAHAAEKLGIPPQTLSSYMMGKVTPHRLMQLKLAAAGADIDYIMTGIRSEEKGTKASSEQNGEGSSIDSGTAGSGKGIQESPLLEKLLCEMVKTNTQLIERMTILENALIYTIQHKDDAASPAPQSTPPSQNAPPPPQQQMAVGI